MNASSTARPSRRKRFTPARIGTYVFLISAAIFSSEITPVPSV